MTTDKFFEELAKLKGQFKLFGCHIRREVLMGPEWYRSPSKQCPICAVAQENGHQMLTTDFVYAGFDLGLHADTRRAIARAADGVAGPMRNRLLRTLGLAEVA